MTSPSLDHSAPSVPYLRRRNTPAQLHALHQLFDTTPHPTRVQRQALANEIGMELKSVTNWFQNRRQISRKKSLPLNENNLPKTCVSHSPARHQHRRSMAPLGRSKISLDRIAALSERPCLTSQLDSPRHPLTPRKSNIQQRDPSSPSELWTHMLSSPAIPQSPGPEGARLAVLSSQEKVLCPLEWACLKARHKKWTDEDMDESSTRPLLTRRRKVDEDGEAFNLDLETPISAHGDASSRNRQKFLFPCQNTAPQCEDMEAAIILLGFKACS